MQNQTLATLRNKVPEVTIAFWAIKILSTTVGETGADFLAVNLGLGAGVTTAIMVVVLAAALTAQMRAQEYVPARYWTTVVLVSVVGTQLTDLLTDSLHVSLYISTIVFAVLLAAAFWSWFKTEHTLSIKTIVTPARERFYWGVVLLTFALGTAAGDLATEAVGLGFTVGTIVFGLLLIAMAIAARFGANRILVFWFAYILTRPFGASLGDLLSQSRHYGGLGLGTVITSVVFLAVIVVLVGVHGTRRTRAREA